MEKKTKYKQTFFLISVVLFNPEASGTYIYHFQSNVSLMLLSIFSHAIKFSTLKFQVLYVADCTLTPLGFM